MKRNVESTKKKRRVKTGAYAVGGGNSKYAQKVKAGRQMYGPGCCGHRSKKAA